MTSLGYRLWHASPASLLNSVILRWERCGHPSEEWQTVRSGPAAGARLLLPNPPSGWALQMAEGTFDGFLYDVITKRRSLRGARVWDVGAHIGYHTLALASQGAEVVAFEPACANYERLCLHVQQNGALASQIRLVQAAVADSDGEMTFRESSDMSGPSTGSHLTAAVTPLRNDEYLGFNAKVVQTVRLDTWLAKETSAPPDIIKLDVEGAEYLAVQGAVGLLAQHKPLLLIEVHHITLMFSLAQLLRDLGYELHLLDPDGATPSRCFIAAY